jgi:hypothetical protein
MDRGCTTEAFNTHKTEAGRIFYPWHPLYGKELAISGKCIRRGTVMFICQVRGVRMLTPLEVPAWMFDSAVCCRLIAAPSARVDVTALFSLRALLNNASGQSAVVKAQHHSTVFGGSDAQKPQTITNSAGHVSACRSETAVAGQHPVTASHSARQAPARREPTPSEPERPAR